MLNELKHLPDTLSRVASFLPTNDLGNLKLVAKPFGQSELLLTHYKKMRVLDNQMKKLFDTITEPDAEKVKQLLEQGVDPNLILKGFAVNTETFLHKAVSRDWPKVVPLLLKAGANPIATNTYGLTPFMIAVRSEQAYITYCMIPYVDKMMASLLKKDLPWGESLKLFKERNSVSAFEYMEDMLKSNIPARCEYQLFFRQAIVSGNVQDWHSAVEEDKKSYLNKKKIKPW